MTPEQFCHHYPSLYHMAAADAWGSIRQYGLRSTSALLDLFGITGCRRNRIETKRRPESVTIQHPTYGTATIRDQKPLNDVKLSRCLQGMTPEQWYRLLNRRVFFWASRDRLNRLLNARAYRGRRHTILSIDAVPLLGRHHASITLSRINSGALPYGGSPRGVDTFRSVEDWPEDTRRGSGELRTPVVELAVDYMVADIADLTVRVEEHDDGETRLLWGAD